MAEKPVVQYCEKWVNVMLKRLFVFFLCLVFSVSVMGGILFGVDYCRVSNLQKPLFARGVPDTLYDDGGSGTYRGLGYEIKLDGELTAEYGYVVSEAEMYLFGQLVFAAIT
jgi:hypothetical protein